MLDDIENHRALELAHHSLIIRHKIWCFAIEGCSSIGGMALSSHSILEEIMAIREVSSTILTLFKTNNDFSYTVSHVRTEIW